jgi:hypothetical protein
MYRIILKSEAGTDYVLANGGASRVAREHVGPDGFDLGSVTAEQPVRPVRATAAKVLNRGQKVLTLGFNVTVELADEREAGFYMLNYEAALPRKGTLELYARKFDGTETKMTMANASVTALRLRATGRTVAIAYTIAGGETT